MALFGLLRLVRFGSSDSLASARFFSARSCSALSSSRFGSSVSLALICSDSSSLRLASPLLASDRFGSVSVRQIRLALTRFFSSRFGARTRFRFGSLPGRPFLLAADHGSHYFADHLNSLASICFGLLLFIRFLFIRFGSHWLVRFGLFIRLLRFRFPASVFRFGSYDYDSARMITNRDLL